MELLLVMGFEVLRNLVMYGTSSVESRFLRVPFFFEFMHKVLSAAYSLIHLRLSITDELDVGQTSSWV